MTGSQVSMLCHLNKRRLFARQESVEKLLFSMYHVSGEYGFGQGR